MFSAYSYRSHYQTSNCFIRHLPSSLNKQSSYSSLRYLRRYPLPGKQKPRTKDSPRVISNAMRPRCFRRFHLPVSFRSPVGLLSCAAQAASQLSRAKIRKLLYHRYQSGGFLLVMYNRRDRRVIPSRNSGGTFHPRGKKCHDALDLFLITTTILPYIPLCYKILR